MKDILWSLIFKSFMIVIIATIIAIPVIVIFPNTSLFFLISIGLSIIVLVGLAGITADLSN